MTGQRLIDAMTRAGWTVLRLAVELNVSSSTVQAWRSGRRNPCCGNMVREVDRLLERDATIEATAPPRIDARIDESFDAV